LSFRIPVMRMIVRIQIKMMMKQTSQRCNIIQADVLF
jgi:hypothetical protein